MHMHMHANVAATELADEWQRKRTREVRAKKKTMS